MGKPKRGDGGIFSGSSILRMIVTSLLVVIILFAAGVPMMMAAVDRVNLSNLNYALDYWGDRGYVAYADPVGDLNVTGNLDVTGAVNADSINAPTGRTATYVIAASDATDLEKSQADRVLTAGEDPGLVINTIYDSLPAAGNFVIYLLGQDFTGVNTTIVMDKKNTGICGLPGTRPTLLKLADGANKDLIQVRNGNNHLEYLYLDGNRYNNTAGNSCSVIDGYDHSFNYVNFRNASGHGLHIGKTAYMVNLNHCWAENNATDGIRTNGAKNWFFDCRVYNNGQYGLAIEGAETPAATGAQNQVANCKFWLNGRSGVYTRNTPITAKDWVFTACDIALNGYHGFELRGADRFKIIGCTIKNNSQDTTNTYDGIYLYSSTYGHSIYNTVIGCLIESDVASTQRYGINEEDANQNNNQYKDNIIIGNTTGQVKTLGVNSIVSGNQGYLASGEIRTVSVPYVAGNVGAIAASWHNPESQDIYIQKIVVKNADEATLAATAAIGIADDAAGTNLGAEFFTAIPLNAATGTVFDSYVAGDTGAQTKWIALQDSASATDGWINMIIADQNSDGTGTIYITYCGQ